MMHHWQYGLNAWKCQKVISRNFEKLYLETSTLSVLSGYISKDHNHDYAHVHNTQLSNKNQAELKCSKTRLMREHEKYVK